jgi:patatin-like phospholipase/acyl hydrolase
MGFQIKDIYEWFGGEAGPQPQDEPIGEQPQDAIKKINNKKIALVLPSGGLRGVIQATILAEIDEQLKDKVKDYKGLGHYVDYIAGTSIGSINAINFAMQNDDGELKFNSQNAVDIFIKNGGQMLQSDNYFNAGLTAPKYRNDNIKAVLQDICGDTKFGDGKLSAKVLITSFSLDRSEPTIWSNIGTEEERRALPYHVWNIDEHKLQDAVLSSSAIPAYLPSHEVTYQRDHTTPTIYNEIDGAFFKSSPITTLIYDICNLDNIALSDLFVLSIGTGKVSTKLSHLIKAGSFGYASSVGKIFYTIYDITQRSDEQHSIALLKDRGGKCEIIDLELTEEQFANTAVDKLENIYDFKNIAEDYLAQHDDYIDMITDELADLINTPEHQGTVEESYFTTLYNKITGWF